MVINAKIKTKLLILALTLFSIQSLASVGTITEQSDEAASISRQKTKLVGNKGTDIKMNDDITTTRGKIGIVFSDDTKIQINNGSRLVVDDFVYDPSKGAGKLAVNMAFGTVRYTSGQIAKNSPQSVSVKTPSATIAVRGTDFSTITDELGRSLIVLLPSCNRGGCVTGAIEVSNEAGTVLLDVAYQATLVASLTTQPSPPVIVNIDQSNINNMLIVSPPSEVKETVYHVEKTALDKNELSVDLLAFKELDKNELDDKKAIDHNDLEIDLLAFVGTDELSAQNKTALGDMFEKNLLPNYNPATNLGYYFNDDRSKTTLYRRPDHIAEVTFDTDRNAQLIINQDGTIVKQQVNQGGSTVVNIKQTK